MMNIEPTRKRYFTVSLAILVWFADALTIISWNLLLVFLISHAAYVLLRILFAPKRIH